MEIVELDFVCALQGTPGSIPFIAMSPKHTQRKLQDLKQEEPEYYHNVISKHKKQSFF